MMSLILFLKKYRDVLQAELTETLEYAKYDKFKKKGGNYRNRFILKTVIFSNGVLNDLKNRRKACVNI